MDLPNVVHPTIFTVNGFRIQIVSFFRLSDNEALALARHHILHRKMKKSEKHLVHTVYVTGDKESVGMI
jgi:hypothetical protein